MKLDLFFHRRPPFRSFTIFLLQVSRSPNSPPLMSLTFNTSTAATATGGRGGGLPQFLQSTRPFSLSLSRTSRIVVASNKSTPRTGKFDSKNRRNASSVTTSKDLEKFPLRRTTIERDEDGGGAEVKEVYADDGFVVEDLDGMKPNF